MFRRPLTRRTSFYQAVVLALAMALVPAVRARAQDAQQALGAYSAKSWGQDDGLPSSRIWAITQDAIGYLWLGTDAGLIRFDGVRFYQWTADAGTPLPKGSVLNVYSARDGSLWIGFGNGSGVSRIRNGLVENYGPGTGIGDGGVNLLLEDRSGTVWAGNIDGLFRLQDDHWQHLGLKQGFPKAAVYGGYEDRAGNLWIGSSIGVLRRQTGQGSFELVDSVRDSVQRFSEDAAGTVWMTDPVQGFIRFGATREPDGPRKSGAGSRLLRDRRSNLWVATLDGGLWCVRQDREAQSSNINVVSVPTEWPNDVVRSLFEDREGNIWAGADSGLYRFTPHKLTPLTHVGRTQVVASTPDGRMWVGTTGGMIEFDGSARRSYGPERGIPAAPITAMFTDRSETLWVATSKGVVRRLNGRFMSVPLPEDPRLSSIRSLATDSHADLWLCDSDEGLFLWRDGRLTPFSPPPELRDRKAIFVYVDRNDRVWIGFTGGNVLIVDREDKTQLHRLADGLGRILTIYEDRDGVLWLGGNYGLSRFKNGRMETAVQSSLPGYAVWSIVQDEAGYLWLGVSSGIVRIDTREFERAVAHPASRRRYELYDTTDGLAGLPTWFGAPSAVRSSNGKLWFVTAGGLTVVDPRTGTGDSPSPPVRIESLTANDQRLNFVPDVVLPPRVSSLLFEYTVLNLTSPMKVSFRHRLEGFDADWVDTGTRREAIYTNLPPGNYRFHVVAASSDGTWNESASTWDFSIRPTFYQTQWFYAICAALVLAAAAASWRLRLRQVRRQFSLVLAERARMSREIHDTLLQGMVGVALQFDALSQTLGPSSSTAQYLVRIRKQVEEYIRETREAIFDLRSPTSGGDLAELLREAGRRIVADKALRFDFSVSGTPRRCGPAVEQQLLRVGQEAIRNAVRHASATQIAVALQYDADSVVLRVSDDGRGFDIEHAYRDNGSHYGLDSMRERTREAGGHLTIETGLGRGTEVQAVIPLGSEA